MQSKVEIWKQINEEYIGLPITWQKARLELYLKKLWSLVDVAASITDSKSAPLNRSGNPP